METIVYLLQIINCIGMLACTIFWFRLWYSNLNNYLRVSQKMEDLERRTEFLEYEVKVIQEPCYRGDNGKL